MSSRADKIAKIHMGMVAEQGCCVCGAPANVHHIRKPGLVGAGQRASHFLTIPLCPVHHDNHSPVGIHGMGREKWEGVYGDQIKIWEEVLINNYKKLLGL